MGDFKEETLVELEAGWILRHDLVHAVEPLHENRGPVIIACISGGMAAPLCKLVSE